MDHIDTIANQGDKYYNCRSIQFVPMIMVSAHIEKNTIVPPFEGTLLWNRLLWMGVAVLSLAATYFRFRFAEPPAKKESRKKRASKVTEINISPLQNQIQNRTAHHNSSPNNRQPHADEALLSEVI